MRDERDYEVEAQGIEKAHHIILWISQILAALCVLQNNPAWAALFSLTFASAAAKFFHCFSSDREKAPLLLGMVSTAVALGLVAWFFLGNQPEWLTFGRLLEVVVLFQWRGFPCVWQLTVVFFVLGLFRLSKKMGERREELVTKLLRFKSSSVDSDSEHDKSSDETLTN